MGSTKQPSFTAMLWSSSNDRYEQSQDSTNLGYAGLYKWTMDALFGSRVSPSRKYKEFAQDDTNYKSRKSINSSSERSRQRSNSWSGLDPAFYRRYDLLQDSSDDNNDITSSRSPLRPLLDPVDLRPRELLQREAPTDTFGGRRKNHHTSHKNDLDDFSIVLQSPRRDDPVISKLFERRNEKARPSSENNYSSHFINTQIPGKFPSPIKNRGKPDHKEYTSEYLQILDQLDRNGQMLDEVGKDIQERQEQHQILENTYREKYLQTRAELINELKHSKRLYDNYYKLYGKYQQLKTISKDALQLQSRVTSLETQLVDTAIEKEKQIHDLTRSVFQVELRLQETQSHKEREALKYQARIAELENQLLQRDVSERHNIGVSSLSYSPSHYKEQSSLSEYNAAVDSQFLKNLV